VVLVLDGFYQIGSMVVWLFLVFKLKGVLVMEVDLNDYECPYSHIESKGGHGLFLVSECFSNSFNRIACSCGFRGLSGVLDPDVLGLKKKRVPIDEDMVPLCMGCRWYGGARGGCLKLFSYSVEPRKVYMCSYFKEVV